MRDLKFYKKQQIYHMEQRDTASSWEKNFQTQSTFKRNSRYFNIPQLINLQNQECIRRRMPMQGLNDDTQNKLNRSFTNSTTALSNQISHQISKFTRRVSAQFSPPKSDYEKQYKPPNSPKLRSFSIQKMISRNKIESAKNKQIHDQRLFNNFKFDKANLSKTSDFSKLRGRSLQFHHKHVNDLYHQSKQPHQYCYYKQTAVKCKVNYKLQNKQKKRFFFIKRRSSDFAATVLDPQKVDDGLKIASNFKGSNIRADKTSPFHMSPGRQLPCHNDMRYMNYLTNFYRDKNNKLIKPKVDYVIAKFKEDLIAQKKQDHQRPKHPNFTRDQVCDTKYFHSQQARKLAQAKTNRF